MPSAIVQLTMMSVPIAEIPGLPRVSPAPAAASGESGENVVPLLPELLSTADAPSRQNTWSAPG